MKYLIAAGVIFALAGCTTSKINQTAMVEQHDQAQAIQTINFIGRYDLTIQLSSSDNFHTATLQDNSDRTHQLKAVPAASGVKLANEDGVSIHFKNNNGTNQGIVELVKGSPIDITEFKD